MTNHKCRLVPLLFGLLVLIILAPAASAAVKGPGGAVTIYRADCTLPAPMPATPPGAVGWKLTPQGGPGDGCILAPMFERTEEKHEDDGSSPDDKICQDDDSWWTCCKKWVAALVAD